MPEFREAKRRWVTDECRANKGDEGAAREAVESLYDEALRCMAGWRHIPGVRFHFVLTIERPDPAKREGPTDAMIRAAMDATYPSHVQEEMKSDELRKGGRLWEHHKWVLTRALQARG